MKMKLKTLKDLHDYGEMGCGGDISSLELKQEAIKWIKADKSNYYSKEGKEETILWIKDFFNITEEDLEVKNDNNRYAKN